MIGVIYTDSDRILAAIGLTSEDISDDFFLSKDLKTILSVDLYNWLPTYSTLHVSVGDTATEAQKHVSNCLTLYCTYFCAAKLLEGGALNIMIKESDGQNEYNRISNIDFNLLKSETIKQAGYYREILLSAISSNSVAIQVAQSTVVAPAYDPVTG